VHPEKSIGTDGICEGMLGIVLCCVHTYNLGCNKERRQQSGAFMYCMIESFLGFPVRKQWDGHGQHHFAFPNMVSVIE